MMFGHQQTSRAGQVPSPDQLKAIELAISSDGGPSGGRNARTNLNNSQKIRLANASECNRLKPTMRKRAISLQLLTDRQTDQAGCKASRDQMVWIDPSLDFACGRRSFSSF